MRVVPDLILVFLIACIYAVICFMIIKKSIPFSDSFDEYNQNSNSGIIFVLMFIVALFAGLHYCQHLVHLRNLPILVIAVIYLAFFGK